ncbi:19108_t:CDS:1, partial [Racocetra persica]
WLKVAVEQRYVKSFEYKSFENWKIIGRGARTILYCAYSRDIDQIVALKRHFDTESVHDFLRQ